MIRYIWSVLIEMKEGEAMKQILCYGDSNTWGLIPGEKKRYPWGTRWTSILQEKVIEKEIRIIEEGLCGRTTIFDDDYRENRNGLKTLPMVLESQRELDGVIIMLGTNDCKSAYMSNAYKIGKGLEQCIDKLLEELPSDKIIIASPIHLGEEVWRQEFDPEFDQNSVEVSKQLLEEYQKLAKKKNIYFLAASDYAAPSEIDQEHMDEQGHAALAEAFYRALQEIKIFC